MLRDGIRVVPDQNRVDKLKQPLTAWFLANTLIGRALAQQS